MRVDHLRRSFASVIGTSIVVVWVSSVAIAVSGPTADKTSTPAGSAVSKATPAVSKVTPCPKPADPIAIRSVSISENPIRAGTSVSGTVVATCNVASVTAQVGTFRIKVPKKSPGIFQTTVDVPRLAWPGHFELIVTAIRTDGFSIHESIPIVVTW